MSDFIEYPKEDPIKAAAILQAKKDQYKNRRCDVCKDIGNFTLVKTEVRCLTCKHKEAANNKERVEAGRKRYRESLKAALHPKANKTLMREYKNYATSLSAILNVEMQVDHIIALSAGTAAGGWHHEENLQILSFISQGNKGSKQNISFKGYRKINGIWTTDWDIDKQIEVIKNL